MPLWLWQEVQALPWSTEIVALTCVPRIACDPRRPYSSVHGKLVVQHRPKTNKRWDAPPLSSLNFLTIRDCSKREDHHQFEIVDIADNGGLRLNDLIKCGTSTGRPRTPGLQNNAVIEVMIGCRDMTRDRRVVDLAISGQQIGYDRYADTGPNVA